VEKDDTKKRSDDQVDQRLIIVVDDDDVDVETGCPCSCSFIDYSTTIKYNNDKLFLNTVITTS